MACLFAADRMTSFVTHQLCSICRYVCEILKLMYFAAQLELDDAISKSNAGTQREASVLNGRHAVD